MGAEEGGMPIYNIVSSLLGSVNRNDNIKVAILLVCYISDERWWKGFQEPYSMKKWLKISLEMHSQRLKMEWCSELRNRSSIQLLPWVNLQTRKSLMLHFFLYLLRKKKA